MKEKLYFCIKQIEIMKTEASIVSIGNWNARIFTPNWVSENIFVMSDGDTMDMGLNEQPQLTLTYIWNKIQLLTSDSRIEFKTNQCTTDTLGQMEQCYLRLAELLPHTPVSAVGFNLNLHLTQEEFQNTKVGKEVKPQSIGDYIGDTLIFKAEKEGAIRSFSISQNNEGGDIRINFHYTDPKHLPAIGTGFEQIASELKDFLGYEFNFR